MRIGRTVPPAASPIPWNLLFQGVAGWCHGLSEVERFEAEIRTRFSVESCFLLSSGKAALTLVLEALKQLHPEQDEVIIPAFTCYSVPSAIVRAGLKVRLCDLHPDTLDFDFEQLAPMLDSRRLLAVIPNHLFGVPADIERLERLVGTRSVTVVEDAAQAFGSSHEGKKLGTLGSVGVFSLGRGKAFSTVEGGIIITRKAELASTLRKKMLSVPRYRPTEILLLIGYALALTVLLHPALFWLPRAIPFLKLGETRFDPGFKIRRMSALQAGLARGWERRLARLQRDRWKNARNWVETIESLQEKHFGGGTDSVIPDFIRFPWVVKSSQRRTEILRESQKKGLGIAATYPDSVAAIPGLQAESLGMAFPVASKLARTLVTLPVHGLLSRKDIHNIIGAIQRQVKTGRSRARE